MEEYKMMENRNDKCVGYGDYSSDDTFFENRETGEYIIFDPETQVIKSKAQVRKQYSKLNAKENPFTWANMKNIKQLLAERRISLTSLGAIIVLASNMGEDGYLRKQTRSTAYLTRAEIQKKLKLGDSTFKRFVKEIKECGLLTIEGTTKNQVFKLNTEYHSYGKVTGKVNELVRIQQYGFNRLYEENSIKLDQIGFMYMLIPYLAYENCTLVRDVTLPTDVNNALSLTELAEVLRINKATVKKYISFQFNYHLKDGDYRMPVVALFRNPNSKKETMLVNPVLFRRRKGFFENIRYSELEEVFKSVSVKL